MVCTQKVATQISMPRYLCKIRTIILFRVLRGDGSLKTLHKCNSVKALKRNSTDGFLNRQLERAIGKPTSPVVVINPHSQYSPRNMNIFTGELFLTE